MKLKLVIVLISSWVFSLSSCTKNWLDEKPDRALTVPVTLSDMQALLDNIVIMNTTTSFTEVGADNYFIKDSTLSSAAELTVVGYLWAYNGYGSNNSITDWETPYKAIFYSNTVLTNLDKLSSEERKRSTWRNIYGSALFFRAYALFNLAEIFCKPYQENSADQDLGIPIRLEPNVSQVVARSSVKETYDQILSDLNAAKVSLPDSSFYKSRPTKAASYGMLARIYLAMEKYDSALYYSNECLKLKPTLIDYKNSGLMFSSAFSFPTAFDQNKEIIFYARTGGGTNLRIANADIDSTLYNSYDANDLRKSAFFRISNLGARKTWAGNYGGTEGNQFGGLAGDEMYLIKAECYARRGDAFNAMKNLNTLLENRWAKDKFVPVAESNADNALGIILNERRKELLYRGIRWSDLRRLNRDPRFSKTIIRIYNKQQYKLEPKENKYVWPIPNSEILVSNISQNPR
jgi:starch-binding outer membrane protein, SusD/RagB family